MKKKIIVLFFSILLAGIILNINIEADAKCIPQGSKGDEQKNINGEIEVLVEGMLPTAALRRVPLPNNFVFLKKNGIILSVKITNENGICIFKNLSPGEYTLTANRFLFFRDHVTVTITNENPKEDAYLLLVSWRC